MHVQHGVHSGWKSWKSWKLNLFSEFGWKSWKSIGFFPALAGKAEIYFLYLIITLPIFFKNPNKLTSMLIMNLRSIV